MAFIYDIDLVTTLHRRELRFFDEFSDIVHASVACRVYFNHIQGVTLSDINADITHTTGMLCRLIALKTVERLCQNPGAGGFARASGASEQICWSNPFGADGVGEGGSDRLLSHQRRKCLGSVFVVEGFVGHGGGG